MDLNLDINGDLQIDGNGDFKTVSGWDEARQAGLRMLFTNPREVLADGTKVYPDYFFNPSWGLGIARLVGQPAGTAFKAAFTQRVREAFKNSEGVDNSKDPLVEFFQYGREFYTRITVPLLNNQSQQLVFQLPGK